MHAKPSNMATRTRIIFIYYHMYNNTMPLPCIGQYLCLPSLSAFSLIVVTYGVEAVRPVGGQ